MTVQANLHIDLFPPSGTIPNKNSLSVLHTQDVLAQCILYIHKWLLPIVSSIHVVVLFDRVLPTRDNSVDAVSSTHSTTLISLAKRGTIYHSVTTERVTICDQDNTITLREYLYP